MDELHIYRQYLERDLQGMSLGRAELNGILANFDKLASTSSPELSFRVMFAAHSGQDEVGQQLIFKRLKSQIQQATASQQQQPPKTVKALIQEELEAYNKSHPGVDRNPLTRWRESIRKQCALIDKMNGVTVNGVDLTEEEIEAIRQQTKPKFPAVLERHFAAVASAKAKLTGLEVEIRL